MLFKPVEWNQKLKILQFSFLMTISTNAQKNRTFI